MFYIYDVLLLLSYSIHIWKNYYSTFGGMRNEGMFIIRLFRWTKYQFTNLESNTAAVQSQFLSFILCIFRNLFSNSFGLFFWFDWCWFRSSSSLHSRVGFAALEKPISSSVNVDGKRVIWMANEIVLHQFFWLTFWIFFREIWLSFSLWLKWNEMLAGE